MKLYFSILFLLCYYTNCKKNYENDNGEKVKKGKKIGYTKDGNIDVSVRYKKWSDPKQRTLCCPLAYKHCKSPCAGLSCKFRTIKMILILMICLPGDAMCTLSCGLFSLYSCAPIRCGIANPFQCVSSSSSTCPTGWTQSGSKCFRVSLQIFIQLLNTFDRYFRIKAYGTATNWLTAQNNCEAQGGTLAKIESAQENAVVQGLISGDVHWIGLQDFLLGELQWSWSDGSALGGYTNWLNGQPDNGASATNPALGQVWRIILILVTMIILLGLCGDETK